MSTLPYSDYLGSDKLRTVACSMASAGFAACMGASPETVLQAAEIGIGKPFCDATGPNGMLITPYEPVLRAQPWPDL